MQLIHVASECFQLFVIPSVVQHFEGTYHAFILVKHPQGLLIKGPKKSTDQLLKVIKELEHNCLSSDNNMTQFKLNDLKILCRMYRVQFEELPRTDSLRTGLLAHFLSLLEPVEEKITYIPSYVEAYRKEIAKEPGEFHFPTLKILIVCCDYILV